MTAAAPFPPDLRFAHEWRPYQARVLAELEPHIADKHLHVVAAPGAGKTVLGLEVIRRLARRALVVTPTITIRNQWIERFRSGFRVDGASQPALIGNQLGAPAPITATTYQALHAAAKSPSGLARLPDLGTLVLDEAHHLRNEWWKVLVGLKAATPELTVVALTATPPLDVSAAEWNRYATLCGPIDAVISVPELVAAGNLCPHQDYLHLSAPTPQEWGEISARRAAVTAFHQDLVGSAKLARAVLGNPRFARFDADPHREAVLSNPEAFSAMVIFLCAAGHECAEQRVFLGAAGAAIPRLDDGWLEVLLNDFLFANPALYDADDGFRRELERDLRRLHAIGRRRVRFDDGQRVLRRLRASDSKVESVRQIFEVERHTLGDDLRLVILTDHVRKEYLGAPIESGNRLRLGAVPIFEVLGADRSHDVPLCLLTGGLVILPRVARDDFAATLADQGIEPPRAIPHPVDERYFLAPVTDSLRQGVVHAVTALFNRGTLHAIIGTAALLAEGWDAQAANTLVIASAVSTHVLSNQMRGRVIRIDATDPGKASNIWHLACVEPVVPGGGDDFTAVRRRFAAFEGVSYDGAVIESGFSRLFDPPPRWSTDDVERINRETNARARERGALVDHWREALDRGDDPTGRGLVEEVRCTHAGLRDHYSYRRPTRDAARRSTLAVAAGAAAGAVTASVVQPAVAVAFALAAFTGLATALRLPGHLARALRGLRNGWSAELVASVGECVLDALGELEELQTPRRNLRLEIMDDGERIRASARGATQYESDQIASCLEEMLGPVENPRYLLALANTRPRQGARPSHYHAVPAMLANKQAAQALAQHWRHRIGKCELVYTRTAEGRLALLRARARSWTTEAGYRPERVNSWR